MAAPVLLRSSERNTFKRCPQRWWWSYIEGLVHVNEEPDALWFGGGIHLALAEHYIPGKKRGRPLVETWEEYAKGSYRKLSAEVTWGEKDEQEFISARELGRAMLEFYQEYTDGDPHWEVLSPEQRFKVAIPLGSSAIIYVGTFDLVIRDLNDGHVKLVDHKTCKALPSEYDLSVLDMDDQAGPYITLSPFTLRKQGIIGPKENVKGMEYNYLAKRRKDPREQNAMGQYLNKDGSVSKVQPPDPFKRHYVSRTAGGRKRQIQRIKDDAQWMELIRSGQLNPLKNVTRDCNWCPFFEMCRIDENGGDIELIKKMSYRKHDPYADHRDGAENSKTSVANKRKTSVQ